MAVPEGFSNPAQPIRWFGSSVKVTEGPGTSTSLSHRYECCSSCKINVLLTAILVWDLRGWTNPKDSGRQARRMHYLESSGHGFEVSRADGQSVPRWKDVEHRQDGRHRLGYNPAVENREIYQEEFEAVQASVKDRARTRSARFDREGGDRAILNRQQRYLAKL